MRSPDGAYSIEAKGGSASNRQYASLAEVVSDKKNEFPANKVLTDSPLHKLIKRLEQDSKIEVRNYYAM